MADTFISLLLKGLQRHPCSHRKQATAFLFSTKKFEKNDEQNYWITWSAGLILARDSLLTVKVSWSLLAEHMEQSVTGLQVRLGYFLLAKCLWFKTSALHFIYAFPIEKSKVKLWGGWQKTLKFNRQNFSGFKGNCLKQPFPYLFQSFYISLNKKVSLQLFQVL